MKIDRICYENWWNFLSIFEKNCAKRDILWAVAMGGVNVGEATFQNIFGCTGRMDLIQRAMDWPHLGASFDMLKCWYMTYIKFFKVDWSQKFWWKSSKKWHPGKKNFLPFFKKVFCIIILKLFEICHNKIL